MKEMQLILGDAYKEIKKIPDKSIDLIITDPPYDIDSYAKRSKSKLDKSYSSLLEQLDNAGVTKGIDYGILDDFVRVSKKINIYIWCNKKQILPYLEYFVKKHGCTYNILVWIKSNPLPSCGRNYINDKEYCLYFKKQAVLHTTYNRGHTYWITPTNKKDKALYNHPTVKPQAIIENLVLNSSNEGDVIFDPFVGSGTTAAASLKFKRKFVGFENRKEHYNTTQNRVMLLNPLC